MKRLSLLVLISTLAIGCNEVEPIQNNIENNNYSSGDIDLDNGKSDTTTPCQFHFKTVIVNNKSLLIKEPSFCNPHAKMYDSDDSMKIEEIINPNIEQQKVLNFYDTQFLQTRSHYSSEI